MSEIERCIECHKVVRGLTRNPIHSQCYKLLKDIITAEVERNASLRKERDEAVALLERLYDGMPTLTCGHYNRHDVTSHCPYCNERQEGFWRMEGIRHKDDCDLILAQKFLNEQAAKALKPKEKR